MILAEVMIALAVAGFVAYLSPWLWRQKVMNATARHLRDARALVLTYDDGPNPTFTPKLLDLLHSYKVKATFFVVGRNAQKYPEIIDRIVQEGHNLGCHTQKHFNAWKTSPWRAVADIDAGYRTLSPWMSPDGMFRPPHGKMTLPTYMSLRRRHAKVWWWTVDSGDTYKILPEPSTVENAVLSARGGIVLFHDLHTQERPEERDAFVIQTTAALLRLARRENLRVASLNEL